MIKQWLGILTGFFWLSCAIAQESTESAQQQRKPVVEMLGDDYQNSITLLSNRFRVDYNVTEVTMVFFREFGSAPVVLVRPDGSKIFKTQVEQSEDERIVWFDTETYDMIKIKDPVPGPWQAVGQILPDSRVMVISDIGLHAEPLPPLIFSGEILKSTAYLTNGGEPIQNSEFRDAVELTIDLISTNNPNYDNFGADQARIATFKDDGRGMDEKPLDGVFTGQFNLSVAAGEWRPLFKVATPLFTREHETRTLMLYPNPVSIDVELDGGGDGYHKLIIDVDRSLVDINTLLIDGKVRFPNGDIQNFSLTKPSEKPREHMIVAFGEGIFRVKLTAYGATVNGRDFILDVPEYTFRAAAPEPEIIDPLVPVTSDEGQTVPEPPKDMPLQPVSSPVPELSYTTDEKASMDNATLVRWLLIVNGSIIAVGAILVVIIVLKRRGKGEGSQLVAKLRGLLSRSSAKNSAEKTGS